MLDHALITVWCTSPFTRLTAKIMKFAFFLPRSLCRFTASSGRFHTFALSHKIKQHKGKAMRQIANAKTGT